MDTMRPLLKLYFVVVVKFCILKFEGTVPVLYGCTVRTVQYGTLYST